VQIDARGGSHWRLSVDSTSAKVRHHGATASGLVIGPTSHTGGNAEQQESARALGGPGDHAIERARGGVTAKAHALVDRNCLPRVIAVTPGKASTLWKTRQL
jgi:hypothetical protein